MTTNKNAIMLPPKILSQQLTCSECHKYLSVGPVVAVRGGRMICGRCHTNSLYDQVAENCLFACVNNKAGCQELLPYNKAKDHETNCGKKTIINCPFCRYEGDERQLFQHFKEDHSEYVVDKIFELSPKEGRSTNLIFIKDEHILCITVITSGKFFKIYNTLLTPSLSKFACFMLSFFKFDSNNHFIAFKIQITYNSIKFPVYTDVNYGDEEKGVNKYVQLENCFLVAHEYLANCLESDSYHCKINYVDNNEQGLEKEKQKLKDQKLLVNKSEPSNICYEKYLLKHIDYVLKMSPAILREFVKEKLKKLSKCGICKRFIADSANGFICPKEHFACESCVGMKCLECESFVQWNNLNKYHNILVSCEWNCKSQINIFKYRQHMRLCGYRPYKCPDKDCQFVGLLDDFKKHWHLNDLKISNQLIISWKEQSFYWLLPDHLELVYITFEIFDVNRGLVTIYEDYALFPEFYRFQLSNCAVEKNWAQIKNGIGRYQNITSRNSNVYISVINS